MSERPEKALSMYDLGAITGFERLAGGTANVNWRVQTDTGEFVLRHRNRRYGSPERVKADHELKSHLAQIGLAVFAPLKSTIGTTWIELDSKIYELYPFVHGKWPSELSAKQLELLGGFLASLHAATESWDGGELFCTPRQDSPGVLTGWLDEVAKTVEDDDGKKRVEYVREQIAKIRKEISDDECQALPHAVIHGDVHPANMLFDGRWLTGLFDWDCASWQPKIRDLVDCFLYCCSHRDGGFDPTTILTLTKKCTPNLPRFEALLDGYGRSLSNDELDKLPWLIRARWISCRLDAKRKIPKQDWPQLLGEDTVTVLEWCDDNGF